jgi:proteic killer suppression protein
MIISFRDGETEKIFHNEVSRKFPPDIQSVALRKLLQIHAAVSLHGLSVPRGNRLEALKGSRLGQHSIRVNDQWRICFVWRTDDDERKLAAGAQDVELVDYH